MRDHLDIADLTLVANNVVDVVLTTDASFSTTFVSPSAEPVLGCPPESARGSRFPDSVHPDDRSRLDALVASAEAAGASNSIEIRVRHHRTGEYLWFDISARRILDPEGRLASHVLVLRDAGGRKQAESALVESEARYREVIDAAHEVIFQTDLRGHWRLLSPSWTVLTEYAVEESLGRSALELVHPDDRAALGAIARELLQSGKAGIQRSTRILTKRGRARWVELSVSLSRGASRVLTGTAGTIRDVTTGHIRSCLNDVARALDRDILEGGKVDTIFQPVCDGLAASMKYPAVGIALRRKDGSVPLVGRAGHALAALDGLTGAWAASPSDRGPCAEAMRTRQTQRLALATGTTPGWVASGLGDGILQVAVMPLVTPNSVLGVLSVAVDDAESLDDDHVSALEALADRLSLALHLANHQTLLALQGAAMASSSSALFITDASGRIEWVNPAFEQMSGYTHDEAIGKSPGILRSDLQPKEVFSNMWSSLRAGRHWRGEIVNRRKSGETYVVSQSVTPLMDEDGSVSHLVAAHEDVTAHKEAETLIEHMAHHDSLTDLPNRAVLVERLQIALVRAERERERLAVLFVDLDRFKLVNDTLGHLVGDQLLREVAARLKSCVRDRDLVARLGGDEFTVLLPSCDTEIATWVAERILTSLRAPVQVGAQDVSITASIGIAFSSPETRDPDSLLRQADAAMYRAKEIGRNGYAFFSAGLDRRPAASLTIQAGLRRALVEHELRLHYQPQMNAADGALVGVEALLRWTSPALGVMSPSDFIPIAEQTGIIADIDRWVLRAACAQARAWRVAGIGVPRVAVNVSGVSFQRGQLLSWIEEALAAAELLPACLEIELTEGIVMHDQARVIGTLDDLRRLGIRIALDDFGTGYSSLGYLKRFKLDVLKIDRTFVTGLPHDQDSAAIARAIVAMAKALRMETVAEGVETIEQANFLAKLGCDCLQGFLFSPGVAPADMARFVNGRSRAGSAAGAAGPRPTDASI